MQWQSLDVKNVLLSLLARVKKYDYVKQDTNIAT